MNLFYKVIEKLIFLLLYETTSHIVLKLSTLRYLGCLC